MVDSTFPVRYFIGAYLVRSSNVKEWAIAITGRCVVDEGKVLVMRCVVYPYIADAFYGVLRHDCGVDAAVSVEDLMEALNEGIGTVVLFGDPCPSDVKNARAKLGAEQVYVVLFMRGPAEFRFNRAKEAGADKVFCTHRLSHAARLVSAALKGDGAAEN